MHYVHGKCSLAVVSYAILIPPLEFWGLALKAGWCYCWSHALICFEGRLVFHHRSLHRLHHFPTTPDTGSWTDPLLCFQATHFSRPAAWLAGWRNRSSNLFSDGTKRDGKTSSDLKKNHSKKRMSLRSATSGSWNGCLAGMHGWVTDLPQQDQAKPSNLADRRFSQCKPTTQGQDTRRTGSERASLL